MNGVVYGGFASHCDHTPYVGWIIGVSTAGVIKARFATSSGTGSGDGIWMSGSGLASDGAGSILFATGNPQGQSPTFAATIASNAPPANLDESAVRVTVQADGSLKPTDFFAPFNAQSMGDDDLAGGGIIALPSQFGTTSVPHTAAIVGKAGLFYLLNRDKLGGYKTGGGNGNAVLTEINLNGGTWGHPAVWPGDGGYIAVTTNGGANAQTGYRLQLLKYAANGANPNMTVVGFGADSTGAIDNFGAYAGSPSVTSNNTTAGSAVFWAVGNSNLRAYKISGSNLVRIFQQSIGSQSKFSTVGVGSGRIYVGTGKGLVYGFGAGTASVSGPAVAFGSVNVGSQSTMTATITANQTLTIPAGGLAVTGSTFTLGTPTPALPATLNANQSLTVPVTFKPTASGAVTGAINVTISGGGGGSIRSAGRHRRRQRSAAQHHTRDGVVRRHHHGHDQADLDPAPEHGQPDAHLRDVDAPGRPLLRHGCPRQRRDARAERDRDRDRDLRAHGGRHVLGQPRRQQQRRQPDDPADGLGGLGASHGDHAAVDRLRHDERGHRGHEDLHDPEHGRHRSADREVEAPGARPVRGDVDAQRGLGAAGRSDAHGVGEVLVSNT